MKAEVKQRGVGAVALLVLGGVVWLLLFGGGADEIVDTRSQIPHPPELIPYEVAEPRQPAIVEPVDAIRPEAVPPASGSTAAATSQTESTEAPSAAPSAAGDRDDTETGAAAPEVVEAGQPVHEPGLDSSGVPEAWVVQVASLGSADNARLLRDRLREQGYKAYTEPTRTATGVATRVLVGPKLSREQADRDKAAIDEALGLNTLVIRFQRNEGG